jgi:hypothetical protein
VLKQLGGLYRDGTLMGRALDEAVARQQADRPALEEQRRALAEEIHQTERALDRYYRAFEAGTSTQRASSRACARSRRASRRSANKTPRSANGSRQKRPQRQTRPISRPSPTNSNAQSPKATQNRRRRYSGC